MPRVKLTEQPYYEFAHTLHVRVTDLNYGSHLSNDAVVRLVHEARVHLLRELGCKELDLGDGQTGFIMGDLAVNFRQEGFLFDELTVQSHVGDITEKSFRLFHRICRNGETLALAETGLVTFNYSVRDIAPVPEVFLQALKAYLQTYAAAA